jgi:hypothetical protein
MYKVVTIIARVMKCVSITFHKAGGARHIKGTEGMKIIF